jgi:O-antigen ligase
MFLTRVGTIAAIAEDDATMDRSAESRLVVIAAQWQMAKHYPFGTGHRGTAVLSTQYIDPLYLSRTHINGHDVVGQRSSHNTFMTAWVEQGIPGAIMYLALWYWVAKSLLRAKDTRTDPDSVHRSILSAAVGGGLALIFVAGQFVDYLKVEVQVWLMALLVVLLQLQRASVAASAPAATAAAAPALKPGVARPPSAPATR